MAGMTRLRALVKATVLEILGEPFVLLLTLSALALAVLAPAFHYHQFGEASRMARDAGISALLLGGGVLSVFCPIRTYRREIESGTVLSALALPVSRPFFFCAKFLGLMVAYLAFVLTVGGVSLTIVNGAEIGGAIAATRGDVARLWGPSLVCAVTTLVLPIVYAAILNRFARFRFTLSANVMALGFALAGTVYRFNAALAARFIPVILLAAVPALVLFAASAAFAVRFRANATAALTALVAAALLPALGNYCLSDALADGGAVGLSYFLLASAAILPAVAALLVLGVGLFKGRDIS